MEIKIINKTGCIMFLDENNNYIDSFFINKYFFDLVTVKQKEVLKDLLQNEKHVYQGIYYRDDKIYLTFKNELGKNCVWEIYNDGWSKEYLQQDLLELADDHLIELHNFIN